MAPKQRGPLTWPLSLRVPMAVADHVRALADAKGMTIHAWLTDRLQDVCADWPWHVVTPPQLPDMDEDTEKAN